MSENPYQSTSTAATTAEPKTRATGWLVWGGVAALGLAGFCIAATIVGMMWAFNTVATSELAPKPSDMASGISFALMLSLASVPLGMLGVVLIVVGLLRRRP